MSAFLQKIQRSIVDAYSIDDLVGIMQGIPLELIKTFINESLKTMDEDKLRSVYYESASIQNVIPSDVIQSALSFLPHQKTTKYVSKSFKKLTVTNETLRKRSREQMISSQFNATNEWHFDGDELQKNKEPKTSITSLKEVFNLMEDGDKLFLYEGTYEVLNEYTFSKATQIEGIGECKIHNNGHYHDPAELYVQNSKVSIKNVSLQTIHVTENGILYLTNCKLAKWGTSGVNENSQLDCFECYFVGDKNSESLSVIEADGPCSLSVIKCLFDYCGGDDNDPSIHLSSEPEQVQLKLIGNKFKNASESPIGKEYSMKCKVNEHAILRNNEINSDPRDVLFAFLIR